MTVTVYKSTDASAPVLNGVAGSLITLLDALLVNGYGSKSSQGWTKPYSGTNQAIYRMATGNQRYLNVIDDGATTAGAANYARVYGLETATAQNTGTNPFPTTAQRAFPGQYVYKSNTVDSVARPWWAYGNGKIIYLWIGCDSSSSFPQLGHLIFGDINSYVVSDLYSTILISNTLTTFAYPNNTDNHGPCHVLAAHCNTLAGHYIARDYTGVGTAKNGQKFTNSSLSGFVNASYSQNAHPLGNFSQNAVGNSSGIGAVNPYPNSADGGLYMERVWWADTGTIRGEMPGLWTPLHNAPLQHLDTFNGSGALAGKSFECLRFPVSGGAAGNLFMEISNTW